jgi:hypothetical protein
MANALRRPKKWPLHMIQKHAAARREIFYKRIMLERLGFVYSTADKAWVHPNGSRFAFKLFDLLNFDKASAKLVQMGFIPNTKNPNLPYLEEDEDPEDC